MKKTYKVSKKCRSNSYWKHLRKFGKRMVNKSTRKIGKEELLKDKN